MLLGFLLAVSLLVYLEASKPTPINWFQSYNNDDTIPFGTYVLDELLEESFQDNYQEHALPPYEVLQDSTLSGTYFFVNNNVNISGSELDKLYEWVEQGNSVFVSAHNHSGDLLDTLNLEMDIGVLFNSVTTEPLLNLTNKKLKRSTPYHIDRDLMVRYFTELDTLEQTVLGVAQVYDDTLSITQPLINFIKAPIGEGAFYLHNQPEAFTNYFLLKEDNKTYTENVLSYINDDRMLYWDRYYKSGKRVNVSPLYLLLNNKYLKWAYYFVLIGALLFVLFEGKRKQRSIPIVKPLTNKTFEYTRTIAGMYYDQKEYHKIAKKQIGLFLEFVRTRLRVPTEVINQRFFEAVAARSGNSVEDTLQLFTFIEKVQHQVETSEEELLKLNTEITEYKKKLDGR